MTISWWTSCHALITRGWRRNWSGYVWVQLYCLSLIGPYFGACIIWLYLVVDLKKGEKINTKFAGNFFWQLANIAKFQIKSIYREIINDQITV